MFIRSAFFFALLICCCLPVQASDLVVLQVEVLPGFSLRLPDVIDLPAAAPGQIVEDATEVEVRANVPWYLQVAGAQWSGSLGQETVNSTLYIQDSQGDWDQPNHLVALTVAAGEPTGDSWYSQTVDFRFTTSFSDPPGSYQMTLEFDIVPQL